MLRRGVARTRLRGEALDPHEPHQTLHALSVDRATAMLQRDGQPSAAVERVLHVQLVDLARQLEVLLRRGRWCPGPVHRRPAHLEELALAPDRQ